MNRAFIWLFVSLLAVFGSSEAAVRVGIVSSSHYCGERELAWRVKIAGENLGWTMFLDENEGRNLRGIKQLDWVICMLPNNEFFQSKNTNYLTVFHPFNYLDDNRKLLPFYEKYDGYLLTISDREILRDSTKLKKKLRYIPFYPSVQKFPYRELPLNNLVTAIPVWSNRLTDVKFQTFYKKLSQTGFVKFYGVNKNEDIIDQGYIGKVPFDGVSVIELLQEYGIVLVLHSDIHNQEGIPTSRIFEAAAASAVIISDENPFVKEHFGDSVFYIDTSLSAESMYEQIQDHLNTIYSDPEKALEMAKLSHQIFTDSFEMSKQLLQLEALHKQTKSKTKPKKRK